MTDIRRDQFFSGRAHLRFARNQREAGIEFLEWEDRMRPRHSWLALIGICAGTIIGAIALLAIVTNSVGVAFAAGWLP
jgi:hypothetical protein